MRRKKIHKYFPVLMTALLYHVVLDLLTDHDHLHLGHQGAVHVELCDHEIPGHLLLDVDGHGADLEADQQGLLHLCGHALQDGCKDQLEIEYTSSPEPCQGCSDSIQTVRRASL